MRDQGNLTPVDNDNVNRCVLALGELIDILTANIASTVPARRSSITVTSEDRKATVTG